MSFPTPFLLGGGVVASYDWLELTSGVGYRRYYACISDLTGGDVYFLTPSSTYEGYPIWPEIATIDQESATLEMDYDFDIEFNIPSVAAAADAFVNISLALWAPAGDVSSYYVVINVIHWDGASETNIGTAQSASRSVTGLATEFFREAIKVGITQQNFGVGDILRFNVQVYAAKGVGDANGQVRFYSDPSSRTTLTETSTSATIGTDVTIDMPFKVTIN